MTSNPPARPPGENLCGAATSAEGLTTPKGTTTTTSSTANASRPPSSSSVPSATPTLQPQKNKVGADRGFGGSASVSSVFSGGTSNSRGSRQSQSGGDGNNPNQKKTNRNQRRKNRNNGRGGGEGRGEGDAGGSETNFKTSDGVPPRPRGGSIASNSTQASDTKKEKGGSTRPNAANKNISANNNKNKTNPGASGGSTATNIKNDKPKPKAGRGQGGKIRAGAGSSSGRGGVLKGNRGGGKSTIQLPQAKLELRRIVFSHLTKYQRIIEDLTRQEDESVKTPSATTNILDPTPGEASAMAREESKAKAIKTADAQTKDVKGNIDSSVEADKEGNADGKDACKNDGHKDIDDEEDDFAIRFLPEDRRQKRRNAYKNAKCMLMMVQDALDGFLNGTLADVIPSLSKNVADNNFRSTKLKESSNGGEKTVPMWHGSNVQFEIDVTSIHNVLLEWAFPPKEEGLAIWEAIETAKTKSNEATVEEPREQMPKMDTCVNAHPPIANVVVRILYATPPKRSRRHGVVPGRIYFVLTPTLASIQEECQRQKGIEQTKIEPSSCLSEQLGPEGKNAKETQMNGNADSTSSKTAIEEGNEGKEIALEDENADKVQSKAPVPVVENTSSSSQQAKGPSASVIDSAVPLPPKLDKGKVLSIAQLILESAEEKIRRNLEALGLASSIQLTRSMNTKTFPEPRYEKPEVMKLDEAAPGTEAKHASSKYGKKKRGGRGEGRYENTLHTTEDYQAFLKMYSEKQGAVKFIVDARDKVNDADMMDANGSKEDESSSKAMNVSAAGTTSTSAATGTSNAQQEKQQPVAAIVKHLQEKRQEEEAKKKALKKQRKLLTEQKRVKKPTSSVALASSSSSAGVSATAPKAKGKKSKSSKSRATSGEGGGDGNSGVGSKKTSSGTTTSKPKGKRGAGRGDGKSGREDARKAKAPNANNSTKKSSGQKSQAINGMQAPVLLKKVANGHATTAPTGGGVSGKSKTSSSAFGQGNKT